MKTLKYVDLDLYHERMMNGDGFQREFFIRPPFDARKTKVIRFYTLMACVLRMNIALPNDLRKYLFKCVLMIPELWE